MHYKRHKCCPFVRQTWIALAFLLTAIFFMAILQLYPDSLHDYPAECQNLTDIGFIIIPQLSDSWTSIADIWVLSTIGVFVLILIPWVLETPQLVARRWMFLLGILYLLRGITVIDTRYPRLPFKGSNFWPNNPIVGAFAIMIGAHSTATDMVFSGHTVSFILIGSFVSRYTNYGWLSYFVWISNILGIIALLAIREHYTTDIIVAIIITKLAFWVYHLFFDSLYKRFWVSGITIEHTGKLDLVLPAQIQDSIGQTLELDKTVLSSSVVENAVLTKNGKSVQVVRFDPFNGARYQLYKVLKWLDFE